MQTPSTLLMKTMTTREQITAAVLEMEEAGRTTKLFQNCIIAGFSVNRYPGRQACRWMVGANLFRGRNPEATRDFIDDHASERKACELLGLSYPPPEHTLPAVRLTQNRLEVL